MRHVIEMLEPRRLLASSIPRLDPSFGHGGVVTSTVPSGDASQVLRAPDGSFLISGDAAGTDGHSVPFLARYQSNGRIDRAFGIKGRIYSPPFRDTGSTTFLPDGKIMVLSDNQLFRLLPNGQTDTTFGINGSAPIPAFGSTDVSWRGVTALPDGHLLLSGALEFSSRTPRPVIAKLKPDASVDRTFGGGDGVTDAGTYLSQIVLRGDGRFVIPGHTTEQFLSNGSPDPAFGHRGTVRLGSVASTDNAALAPDGSLILAGPNRGGTRIVVTRVKTNGSIDRTFGSNGFSHLVFTNSRGEVDESQSIGFGVEADGAVVVAASLFTLSPFAYDPLGIAKLRPDGHYDASFGAGGKVTFGVGITQAQFHSALVQPDGKLVVGGLVFEGPELLLRFQTNGKLDPTFGNKGIATTDRNGKVLDLSAAITLPNGKILAAGGTPSLHNRSDIVVARFNPDGSDDKSFGGDGRVTLDLGGTEEASALALAPNGKILVTSSDERPLLVRFKSDGSLDKTFGHKGVVTNLPGRISSIVVQRDGKIVIGGEAPWLVARLNVDGSIDKTYGKAGISRLFADVAKPTGHETFFVNTLALQPDGKLLIGGGENKEEFAGDFLVLARCTTSGNVDRTFAGKGVYISHLFDEDDFVDPAFITGIALDRHNEIIAAGFGVLLKLRPDGKLDSGFGYGGFGLFEPDVVKAISVRNNDKIVVLSGGNDPDELLQFKANGALDSTFGDNGAFAFGFDDTFQSISLDAKGRIVVAGTSLERLIA